MNKFKVLFVCLGNICRSPLAAAILKNKIRNSEMNSWVEVDSCGTSNYHIGDTADPRTLANASRNNVIIDHCVRQLTKDDLKKFDMIFAMDKNNYQNILRLPNARDFEHKIKMMRQFDSLVEGEEVPDPYHGDEKSFQEVFEMLNRSIDNFIGYLKKEHHIK